MLADEVAGHQPATVSMLRPVSGRRLSARVERALRSPRPEMSTPCRTIRGRRCGSHAWDPAPPRHRVVSVPASAAEFDVGSVDVGSASLTAVSVDSPSHKKLTGNEGTFDKILAQVDAAQVELVRARPDAFKALWSNRETVTLTGGLCGAIE